MGIGTDIAGSVSAALFRLTSKRPDHPGATLLACREVKSTSVEFLAAVCFIIGQALESYVHSAYCSVCSLACTANLYPQRMAAERRK